MIKKIFISFVIMAILTMGGRPVNNSQMIDSRLPLVQNGKLITQFKTLPLDSIVYVEVCDTPIKFVILYYELDKYHSGMMTMDYRTFLRKVAPYLRKL